MQVLRHPWMTSTKASTRRASVPLAKPLRRALNGDMPILPIEEEDPIDGHASEQCSLLGTSCCFTPIPFPPLLSLPPSAHPPRPPPLAGKPNGSPLTPTTYGAIYPPAAADGSNGGLRHCRSSMSLERMLMPVNVLSRTPPMARRPRPPPSMPRPTGGGAGTQQKLAKPRGDVSKMVIVSYCPQTLHNSVAGDLSSTSNLSMKYSNQDKRGQRRG